MVKRLRRRPLTAKSAVRVRLEVPTICQLKSVGFFVGTSNVLRTSSAPLRADSNRWSRLSSTASHILPCPRLTFFKQKRESATLLFVFLLIIIFLQLPKHAKQLFGDFQPCQHLPRYEHVWSILQVDLVYSRLK